MVRERTLESRDSLGQEPIWPGNVVNHFRELSLLVHEWQQIRSDSFDGRLYHSPRDYYSGVIASVLRAIDS